MRFEGKVINNVPCIPCRFFIKQIQTCFRMFLHIYQLYDRCLLLNHYEHAEMLAKLIVIAPLDFFFFFFLERKNFVWEAMAPMAPSGCANVCQLQSLCWMQHRVHNFLKIVGEGAFVEPNPILFNSNYSSGVLNEVYFFEHTASES